MGTVAVLAAILAQLACDQRATAPTGPALPGPSYATSSEASYELIQLGGEDSQAIDLNGVGVVVGAATVDLQQRAVYWTVDDGGNVDGPFELDLPGDEIEAWALGVNEAGHVIALERESYRGFTYDIATGVLTELSRPDEAIGVTPRSLSEGDVVTGNAIYEVDGETAYLPVVWTDPFNTGAEPTPLPLPEGHVDSCSLPVPLNDAGAMVARLRHEDGTCWLVRWQLESDGSVSGPQVLESSESSFFRWMNEAEQMPGFTGAGTLSRQAVVREPDGSLIELDPVAGDPQATAVGLNDPASGEPLQVAGTSDPGGEDEKPVVWSVASDGTASAPLEVPLGEDGVAGRGSSVNTAGWVVGELTYDDPHPRRSGGRVAALWLPVADDGESDDGDDCVPKGPNGNNCK
jgi:hypothetical protein